MKSALWEIKEDSAEYILIKDSGNHKQILTITNDAEKVVNDLWKNKHLIPNKKIFYIDSEKLIDELLWEPLAFGGVKFKGFQAGLEYLKLKKKKK